MTLKSQAAAGVRWTSISSLVLTLAEVLRTTILARMLSPLDFGLMAMVMVGIGFVGTFTDLGISAAIIHRQDATKEELSSLYWLNIFVGLAVFGLFWLLAPWIPIFFREPRVLPLLKVIAVVFIIVPIGSQFEILLQKELRFKVLAQFEIVTYLSSIVVAVLCAVAGFGVWTLACSFLTSVVVKTLLLACIGVTRFRPSLHFARQDLKGYVGFGLFQMGERSINYLAERLDQVLIGPLLGAKALGFYNFALNLTAQPIWKINPILTRVAFPLFSKVQDDTDRLRRGYLRLIGLLTTVNAPLLIGLAAVAPWAVPSIFGAKWSQSVILIQILSFVSLSRSISNPLGSLQLAKGRADLGFWWNVSLLACSIPAIYVGGRIGQAIGVAVALLLLQVCANVPAYLFQVRPIIGRCGRGYASAVLKPLSVACLMGLAVISLPALSKGIPVTMQLISQIALGAFLYVMLLAVFQKKALFEFQSVLSSH